MLLDGKNRARRITVSLGRESVRLDVRYSGVAPTVKIPPADQLAAKTPPAPGPTGPFLTVRTGNDAGVAWTLQKAPGRAGTECWRWSSTPPLTVVQPNYLADTRCLAPMESATDDPADQVDFLWTDGTRPRRRAWWRGSRRASPRRRSGSPEPGTEATPVSDGLLTWVGVAERRAARLRGAADRRDHDRLRGRRGGESRRPDQRRARGRSVPLGLVLPEQLTRPTGRAGPVPRGRAATGAARPSTGT